MSIDTPKPLAVRVAYRVNAVLANMACRTLPINTSGGPLNPVSPATLQPYLDNHPDVRTGAQLLASLPADDKRHWIFMTRSESSQGASPLFPRVLAPSQDASDFFAFELDDGTGSRSPDTVEYMAFDAAKNRVTFQSVDMVHGKVVSHNDKNDTTCSSCHSGRPNWDADDNWGGMLPFNRDRFYEGAIEVKANLNGANGLIMLGGNEAPGVDNVSQEIFRRSQQEYEFDKIVGAAIDREKYGALEEDLRIALFRRFLLPAKIPVDGWSMSVNSRSGTFTFGDVFGPTDVNLYLPAIRASILTQAGFAAKSCAQLQEASFQSDKKAIAADPTYFDNP